MLASMRCSQCAWPMGSRPRVGGYQASTTWSPRGAHAPPARPGHWELISAIPGVSCVRPQAAVHVPAPGPGGSPDRVNDQNSSRRTVAGKKTRAAGAGHGQLAQPDHFRPGVPAAYEDDLREAIGRVARFLEVIAAATAPSIIHCQA